MRYRILLREVRLLAVLVIVVFYVSGKYDLLERFLEFSRNYEQWELDEILVTSVVLSIVLLARLARRGRKLEEEIGRRKLAESKNRELAFQDSLTGLPNRRMFMKKLHFLSEEVSSKESSHAVIFIDLDNFKEVNDSFGHLAGDELLCQFSKRARRCIKQSDSVFRIAGDEFTVLMTDISEPHEAAIVAERIISNVSSFFRIKHEEVHVSVSIGIAIMPQDSTSSEELISFADKAMYAVKNQGKDSYQFFNESIRKEEFERLEIVSMLKKATKCGGFTVEYQPIYDRSGTVIQLEALVRLQGGDRKLIAPDKFIPIAEKSGLIRSITNNVIDSVCSQINRWSEIDFQIDKISINLSTIDLDDESFPKRALSILKKNSISPQNIEFEITETALMTNIDTATRTLENLCDLGFTIAIDDFGIEYSSLSYLSRLPIHKLKIDKHFIKSVESSKQSRNIFSAIVGLGEALDLIVVAEGIETEFQAHYAIRSNVHAFQGFYYNPSLTPDSVFELTRV